MPPARVHFIQMSMLKPQLSTPTASIQMAVHSKLGLLNSELPCQLEPLVCQPYWTLLLLLKWLLLLP